MKLLHIGDVVGAAGSRFLQEHLPAIKRTHKIDMIVVNGENSAQGNGITKHSMEQIFSAGADEMCIRDRICTVFICCLLVFSA